MVFVPRSPADVHFRRDSTVRGRAARDQVLDLLFGGEPVFEFFARLKPAIERAEIGRPPDHWLTPAMGGGVQIRPYIERHRGRGTDLFAAVGRCPPRCTAS